uniref:Myosin tail domain-containing protein n=1 Tax=Myripristis murdjan TaxID=586833 RepID=A0A667XAY4_9TELE
MESHRMSGAPDIRLQRSYIQQHSPRGNPDNLFGVRVQVQGIKGHPYVILNSSGQESHRDVSVITHQPGYNPGVARGSPLGMSVDETPANRATQCAHSSPELREAQRTAASSVFHYHRHPEILRPYDPESNNLSLLVPSQTASAARPGRTQPETAQAATVTKARIPLPAQSKASASGTETPARSPNSVDTDPISSVGKLIDRFNLPQRRGRCGPRNRLDPEECRRSRSVDSRRTSDSSSCSSRASSLRGIRGESPGGTRTSVSPRAWFFGEETASANQKEENMSITRLKVQHRKDPVILQVTPDLLKGQQELSADSNEDTAKQILFTYLQDGTTDNDSTTQRKVSLLFEKINKLKWKTAENVEEEEKDYAAEAKALQEKQAALEKEVSELKKQLEIETKTLAKACEKARTEKKNLQEELAKSQAELSKLRDRLAETETELQSTKHELVRMKAERDRSKTEMKDLQQQLSEMHDELDRAKKMEVVNTEKEVLLKDMAQLRADLQEVLQMQEEQEDTLYRRERELGALKGALKEEVETHDKEMASLKEEYEQEVTKLLMAVDQAKEVTMKEKAQAEEARGAAKMQAEELSEERDQLKGKVQELENEVDQLSHKIQESRAVEKLLEQRAKHLEREKQQVEDELIDVRKKEEEMCESNQSLLSRLEDVQSKLTKLNYEHRELNEKLKEERKQIESLWKVKSHLEEERRLQDKMVEQLQSKMTSIMEECEASTDKLQSQVDEARDKSQRELAELRRQLQEKGVELEKSRQTAKKLQEELLPLEEDLRQCRREQQEAQLRGRQLEQRVEELEERNTSRVGERGRQVKLMEVTNREMDQMRSELLQERAARQDLECDKMSLERQNKDLKSRVTHLEASQRSNQDSLVSRLNSRIQELEARLQGEERDNNNLQQTNRKLERRVKEMKMQVDEEHIALQSERDQLTQRLKTAKRQMDEAEEEIERLEHAKKKLQRDLDEQIEANEQLHGQVSALRSEMRRKKSTPLMMIVEDDVNDRLWNYCEKSLC